MTHHYKLVIGNYNYSSWSLRVWLHAKLSLPEEALEVVRVPLYTDNYKAKLLEHSPAGRVPILIITKNDDNNTATTSPVVIWDSLAIMDFVLEQQLQQGNATVIGWPTFSNNDDSSARAMARSIACEFHSGFLSIRDELPQNIRRHGAPPLNYETELSESCRLQIQRVDEIWTTCYKKQQQRNNHDDNTIVGPWLFGSTMTIADIMYVPVALRFWVYGIPVSQEAKRFIDAVLDDSLVQEWIKMAEAETEHLDFVDNLIPAAQSPLVL